MTEANLKNQVLQGQENSNVNPTNELNSENIKNEIIMIQFKLVRTVDMRTHNTFTFVNLPGTKQQDINYRTLSEIIFKLNDHPFITSHQKSMSLSKETSTQQYLPYNKSILTRVLFDQLRESNILIISHFCKRTLQKFIEIPANMQTGASKGIFAQQIQLGLEKLDFYKKRKISTAKALECLEKFFVAECEQIYSEIQQFREGKKSLE